MDKLNKDNLLLKAGYKIKFERKKKGFSQDKLAELTHLSTNTIVNIETGKTDAKLSNFFAIAIALGLNLGDFSDFRL